MDHTYVGNSSFQANNEIQNLKSQSEESVLKQRLHVQTLEAKLEKLQKENQDKTAQLRKVGRYRHNEWCLKEACCCLRPSCFRNSALFVPSYKKTFVVQVSTKLSDIENESHTSSLKLNLHSRALETKISRLEEEIKKKDDKLREVNAFYLPMQQTLGYTELNVLLKWILF